VTRRTPGRLAPPRTAYAHDGHDHDGIPIARPVAPARPTRRVDPHGSVAIPFVTLAGAPAPTGKAEPAPAGGIGAKAGSLRRLAGHGLRVPAAIVLPADAASALARGDSLTRHMAEGALARWLDPGARYAVRSSADVEDGIVHSWAGQLETRLDVAADAVPAVLAAVAAPDGERARAYAERIGATAAPRVAVILQEMVRAETAGVVFSRNPLTGLDEVVVEAVPGTGDALVDAGVTPDRWVWRWGTFTEEPEAPRVPRATIERVVRVALRVAKAEGRPVDLEWAADGSGEWWLQLRPMTGLDGVRVYSNRISREVMPGIIRPLVWSLNVPIVNGAWVDLLERLTGPLGIAPERLARRLGCRAYFDMTTFGEVFAALGMPPETLELLLGMPRGPEAPRFKPTKATWRHMPRMLRFGAWAARADGWATREVAAIGAEVDRIAAMDPANLDVPALLRRVEALTVLTRRAAWANIVIPLLMLGYGRGLSGAITRAGLDPLAADPAADRPDRAAWDPNVTLDALRATADALPEPLVARLADDPALLATEPELAGLRSGIDAFLARFGHLSANGNDASVAPWREDRAATVRMVLAHPRRTPRAGGAVTRDALLAATPRLRRRTAALLWDRAGAFRVHREAISSTYTRGYGLCRGTFLALGARLVAAGRLGAPDEIWDLELDEIRTLAAGGPLADPSAAERIAARRAEMAEAADLLVPELVFGDAFVARRPEERVRARLSGIPSARGSARGTARVVRGRDDFASVGSGEILVIPYSDVGWTPLFARAAGVVAEAGGLLSHAAIVAREYGIPCVVSVAGACSAIPDGATVHVDGVTGSVTIEEQPVAP